MKIASTLVLITLFYCTAIARDLRREINLRGEWRFQVGDDIEYADPNFDDSQWDKIEVPGFWEDLGFPGYDGYAWYRVYVKLPGDLREKMLYLRLGRINDVDMVYVNNVYLNGTGSFPPDFRAAANEERTYYLPPNTLNFDDVNLIAVRVYDVGNIGGIYDGPLGIYSRQDVVQLEMDLSGTWKFSTGDHKSWSDLEYDDSGWDDITVPALWETQGYRWHDGYAWYRKHFTMNKELAKGKPILVLGKINDIDEIFFNGVRIGSTGNFPGEQAGYSNVNYHLRERYYYIPRHLIKWNTENLIAIRVYDMGRVGGIYEGPIGLTTQQEFMKKHNRRKKSVPDLINDLIDDWF
ncbi:glycoside hydrolase [candidate division KSB1 bacterium]|nr:glycoside hydrolase [candidate division KSB1 bacterium]